jgi:hypothetical protein
MTMPAPLRHFYGLIGGWSDAIVQNVLLSPPDLPQLKREKWAETRTERDKLIFYAENQGVCEWATALSQADDAPVWIRGSTLRGDLHGWELEQSPLSTFLIELLVFEAVLGAAHGASVAWLDRRQLAQLLEPLRPIAFGPWRWPSYPSEFYAGDRLLAFAGPNPGPGESELTTDRISLMIGSLDTDALAYLDDVARPEWEWFSRRDGPATR